MILTSILKSSANNAAFIEKGMNEEDRQQPVGRSKTNGNIINGIGYPF